MAGSFYKLLINYTLKILENFPLYYEENGEIRLC